MILQFSAVHISDLTYLGCLIFITVLFRKFMIEKQHKCPYCKSIFKSSKDMSTHIDRIHGESGFLEGSTKKFP